MSLLNNVLDYITNYESKYGFKLSVIRLCRDHNIAISQNLKLKELKFGLMITRLYGRPVVEKLNSAGEAICILCDKNE